MVAVSVPPSFITDPFVYDAKTLVRETPQLFHRQAPGFPMRTRCGIEFDDKTRQTSHRLAERTPCAVCFSWPNVGASRAP